MEKIFILSEKLLHILYDNILIKNNILWISRALNKTEYIDLSIPSQSY